MSYDQSVILWHTDIDLTCIALAIHLEIDGVEDLLDTGEFSDEFDSIDEALEDLLDSEIAESSGCMYGYGEAYKADGCEWVVLTDEDADAAWDESLDNYIDDCLEIPKNLEPYFDREKWKRDARMDGRAHSLGHYDGQEHEVSLEVGGKTEYFYIYRTN